MNLTSNPIAYIVGSILDVDLLNSTSDLTNQLHNEAMKAGWPVPIYSQLSVAVEDGEIAVDIPATVKEQVETLEYGTENTPPNPVIRNFMMTLRKRAFA